MNDVVAMGTVVVLCELKGTPCECLASSLSIERTGFDSGAIETDDACD